MKPLQERAGRFLHERGECQGPASAALLDKWADLLADFAKQESEALVADCRASTDAADAARTWIARVFGLKRNAAGQLIDPANLFIDPPLSVYEQDAGSLARMLEAFHAEGVKEGRRQITAEERRT